MEVRDIKQSDIGAVRDVARETWSHTYREVIPESVQKEFLDRAYSDASLSRRMEAGVFLVAAVDTDVDAKVLGFANLNRISRSEVFLGAIYVLPEAQGLGIGSRLLEAGIGRFQAAERFVLRVERNNSKARRFYEARGFRATGEFEEVLYGHTVHETEMVLDKNLRRSV